MAKSSIMIDIDDPRSDKIADAISNKTSKKILGLLAEGELSGSEVASKLGLPLNTVSYNLKKLYDAGLVVKSKKVFWSSKGKRMEIYKLSNRQIVISPRKIVRGVMPALIVSVLLALVIAFSFGGFVGDDKLLAERQIDAGAGAVSGAAAPSAAMLESEMAEEKAKAESDGAGLYESLDEAPNVWAWYLIGALTALVVVVLWNMRRNEE